MDIQQLYSKGFEVYNAKNFDEALKIAKDLQEIAPNVRYGYYLEAAIWNKRANPVKEFYALKRLLPLLNFSSAKERSFAAKILWLIGDICYKKLYLFQEALEAYLLCIKSDEKKRSINILESLILLSNAVENFSAEDFRALYDEYKKFFADIVPYPKKFYNHEKIRIGFLSGDFKYHAAMTWEWALLTKLNKNHFKIYCYSNVKEPNNVANYLSSTVDGWRDIHDLTDEKVAKLIRDDEIDILFDLSGYVPNSRLRVAVYRPASVQISGIGYMNSTGLDAVDYFLSDVYCAGDSEKYFIEKLIILPHSHICYEAPSSIEPAAEPPCIKNNFVTFGCFNHFGKVTDSILKTWKKILDAVPNSRLILKHQIFDADNVKSFVSERLKNLGFDLSRVEMRPYSSDWLLQYADVDIALDTFPYTGGVTTCEALYMGVPVISLYGDRHGTRFGLSILSNVGLNELAVDSYDEYIKRAVALAGDWELLKILRKNLRIMMKKSPLTDAEGYVREVEKVFVKILSDEREKFSSK